MTKSTKGHVRPAKTQISLRRVLAVRLSAGEDLMLLQPHNENSYQTGRMPS